MRPPSSFDSEFLLMRDIKASHLILGLTAFFSLFLFQYKLLNLGNNFSPRSFFAFATLAAILLVLAISTVRRRQLVWTREHLALFLGPLLGIALQVWLGMRPVGIEPVIYLVIAFLLAGVIMGYLQVDIPRRHWTRIMFVMGFGLVVQTCLGLFHWTLLDIPALHFALPQKFATFYGGFFQKNHFATFNATMTLWLGWALSGGLPMARLARIVLILASGLLAFTVFLTGSKMGVLGFTGGAFLLAFVYCKRRRSTPLRRMFMGWALTVGGAYILAELVAPVDSADYAFSGDSYQNRLMMWHISWLAFLEAPVFGHGLGSFPAVYNEMFPRFAPAFSYVIEDNTADPHNLVMWLLVEAGISGTVLFLAPLLAIGVRALRVRPQNWFLVAVLFPLILHTQLEYPHKGSGSHYLLMLLVFGSLVGQRMHNLRHPLRVLHLPDHPSRFLPVGFIAGLAAMILVVSVHAAIMANVFSQRHRAAMQMPLREALALRLQQDDITHPLIGRFALRQSVFLFAIRALRDGEVVATASFLRPMFAAHVLSHMQGRKLWQIMVDMYLLERDWEEALVFANQVANYNPVASEALKQRIGEFRVADAGSEKFRDLLREYRRQIDAEFDTMDARN